MRISKRSVLSLALFALLAMLAGCEELPPHEVRVRTFAAELERLAEAREFAPLVDHIAGDYLDARGNDKLRAAAILRAFYLRNKAVHLHVRVAEVRALDDDRASMTAYVAMAQRPFPETGRLPEADIFRVDMELAATGDSYEILQSEWARASAADLLF